MKREIREHWNRVANLPCVVSGTGPVQLHHVHGGSIKDAGVHSAMGRKSSDWLVIPLAAHYHVGALGIDGALSVPEWERRFGAQADHLDDVCRSLGVNVWKLAGVDREVEGC